MNKCLLIYNARLLDEAMDTPGALLVVDSKIRSVFQGYFTSADTVFRVFVMISNVMIINVISIFLIFFIYISSLFVIIPRK